jgi:hypothetical protein
MANKLPPYNWRDMRAGRISKDAVSNFIIPENSVSNSLNVNFDDVIGSAKVRAGTVLLGDTVAADNTPLGLYSFVGTSGTPKLLVAVFSNGTAGTIYYYDTAWNTASTFTGLDPTAINNFAVLGGSVFITNSVDGMQDSTDADTWGVDNSISGVYPSVIFRYAGRMLCAGDPGNPDRVYFSSIIDPTSSPFITWDTVNDWIDINPDDGGFVTGFSETSTFILIFKNTGFYRMDSVSRAVDPENIFNIGAPSQQAITLCQGVTYYFSGQDIRRTNGGFPDQISRLGVQDFIDAIPNTEWSNVCAGTDGLNVYFSIGDVTLNQNKDNQRDYTNVVLKFSPRDQNWSVHSYATRIKFFAPYVTNITVSN